MARTLVRGGLVVFGALSILGGFVALSAGPVAVTSGLWAVGFGLFLIVVAFVERGRYRSEAAERTDTASGPGGGELPGAPLEPRFQPTAETFVDPTSGRAMRVLVDPRTGERRYVAEA